MVGSRAWLAALAAAAIVAGPAAHAWGGPKKGAAKGSAAASGDDDDDDAKSKGKSKGDDDDDDDDAKAKKPAAKAAAPAKAAAKGSAAAKGDDDDDDAAKSKGKGDDDDDDASTKKSAAASSSSSAGAGAGSGDTRTELQKQDLTGHDLGAAKHPQPYEKDRFFVDKVDSDSTEDRTLIQGSLTLSLFGYTESGGAYGNAGANTVGNDTTAPARYWADFRLQTDFRHIDGGRWDGRVDFRTRFVNTPDNDVEGPGGQDLVPTQPNYVQSGYLGQNEYDLRELWLIRNGTRTDVIIGRQFIPDLGAVKIDGLRVDYASSTKFTYLGFAGLYPVRGSRSITTDYEDLKNPDGTDAGRFVGAAGFGGAYRTQQAYGSVGGVALVPIDGTEGPRIFGTSQGYWRVNPVLDVYHFALIDVVSSYGAQLTNLSGGINYKPSAALRLTASFNRVDTDTLNIQAAQFFTSVDPSTIGSPGYVINEIYITRIATNEARASVSAALGNNQRFELTAAVSYKERPSFTLTPTVGPGMTTTGVDLPAAQSVEIYGSITDRRSFKDLRLGVDGLQTIAIGDTAFERAEVFAVRGFVARELASGNGEWELEASYAASSDKTTGTTCASVATCFGASDTSVLSAGGTIYYRLTSNWFTVASLWFERTSIKTSQPTATSDAPIDGITGFARIAYRF